MGLNRMQLHDDGIARLCQSQTINHLTRHCFNKLSEMRVNILRLMANGITWWNWWSRNCELWNVVIFIVLLAFDKCWSIIKVKAIEKCEKNRFEIIIISFIFDVICLILIVCTWNTHVRKTCCFKMNHYFLCQNIIIFYIII